MEIRRSYHSASPFFSVCIPQYNRTSFLIEACKSIESQIFQGVEVCISDDCSTDGREADLLGFLECSKLSYVYKRQTKNLRYDGNIRESIALSTGQFCFLLGNDDGLSDPKTLADMHALMLQHEPVSVAMTNYRQIGSSRVFRRVRSTGIAGAGPSMAIRAFRDFSFVSGIVLNGPEARSQATDRWDGSEMYQMYLGCRMLAAGGRFLGIDRVCIEKDLQVPGETVDSYALKPRVHPCPIQERQLPMGQILSLVADAVASHQSERDRQRGIVQIAAQLFGFTYAFWLVEFRRVQSWQYALGVYLGLHPRNTLAGIQLSPWRQFEIWGLYAWAGMSGLTIPVDLFLALQSRLYSLAKRKPA